MATAIASATAGGTTRAMDLLNVTYAYGGLKDWDPTAFNSSS